MTLRAFDCNSMQGGINALVVLPLPHEAPYVAYDRRGGHLKEGLAITEFGRPRLQKMVIPAGTSYATPRIEDSAKDSIKLKT
jgi:hypothetical protein